MKKSTSILIGLFVLTLILGTADWWRRSGPFTTTIKLSGTIGSSFTGYYVQGGRRVEVSAFLPWKFKGEAITEFEFRKVNPAEPFAYEVYHNGMGQSYLAGSVAPGDLGLRSKIRYRSISTALIRHA